MKEWGVTLRANNVAMEELHLRRRETKIKKEFDERERGLRNLRREVEEQEKFLDEKMRKIEEEKRSLINSVMSQGEGEGMVVVGQQNLVAIQLCIVTPENPGTDKASDEQQHLDTLEKGKDFLEGKPKDPKKGSSIGSQFYS